MKNKYLVITLVNKFLKFKGLCTSPLHNIQTLPL